MSGMNDRKGVGAPPSISLPLAPIMCSCPTKASVMGLSQLAPIAIREVGYGTGPTTCRVDPGRRCRTSHHRKGWFRVKTQDGRDTPNQRTGFVPERNLVPIGRFRLEVIVCRRKDSLCGRKRSRRAGKGSNRKLASREKNDFVPDGNIREKSRMIRATEESK